MGDRGCLALPVGILGLWVSTESPSKDARLPESVRVSFLCLHWLLGLIGVLLAGYVSFTVLRGPFGGA